MCVTVHRYFLLHVLRKATLTTLACPDHPFLRELHPSGLKEQMEGLNLPLFWWPYKHVELLPHFFLNCTEYISDCRCAVSPGCKPNFPLGNNED